MKIAEALDIPEFSDLSEFITRINDNEARVLQSLKTFVVPANLEAKLDKLLAAVGHNLGQQQDIGRYIYGTFGSGKSHLMTVLAKMLEHDETVYAVGDEALSRLRAKHKWVDEHKTLVVRVNMMGKQSLSSALYETYNSSLPNGTDPVVFTDEKDVFDLFERDAARFGTLEEHIARLVDGAVIPSLSFYQRMRQGTEEQRLDLAARIESWRNHGKTIRPEDLWVDAEEGFARIAKHARVCGYTAVCWMIDELVIWIRGHSARDYVEQINQLSSLVDHDRKSDRPTPFFVAVAVQQDIAATCPQDVSEHSFREQLGFIANRFQPQLDLEDQDLFEVASRRVLRPKADKAEAWKAAVDATFTKHKAEVQKLSGDIEPSLIRDLYPFHPALLRVLVDVTQGLSRSRSAMSALYGLLKAQQDLHVGYFIPVGALYDILFTRDNVEAVRNRGQSLLAQRLVDAAETYDRLKPRLDRASELASAEPNELHQLVKTTLLCQLSERPYFNTEPLANRVKASFLLHLNQSDVRSTHPRLGLSKVKGLFTKIDSTEVSVGDGTDPVIRIQTERVDSDSVLKAATSELEHADEFAYLRAVIDDVLGLNLGTSLSAKLEVTNWRGTKRKGQLRLANVRTLSYAGKENEFSAGADEFLVLIDYPFDEDETKTRKDDIEQVQRARERGRQWTVAWLPDHLTPGERQALTKAAAVERIRRDKRRFLDNYSPRDAERISRNLEHHQATQRAVLDQAIRRVYIDDGEVHGLSDLLTNVSHKGKDITKVPAGLASDIIDARYPNHPHFTRRVTTRDLETLAEHVVKAAVTGQSVELKSKDVDLVHAFAVPLEMVYPGQSSISRRPDGRYLQRLHEAIGSSQRVAAADIRKVLTTDGKDGLGFTDEVVRFFLYYLLHAEGYAAQGRAGGLTIQSFRDIPVAFDLVVAQVVSHANWDHALAAERVLFGKGVKSKRADIPSVPEQEKLARDVESSASSARGKVTELRTKLTTVLAWAGLRTEESARARTLQALENSLVQLSDQQTARDRVELLAKLGADDATLTEYGQVLVTVEAEQRALDAIDAQKLAFAQIRDRGTSDHEKNLTLELTNRLKAPVASSLDELARTWPERAQTSFQKLLERTSPGAPTQDDELRRAEEEKRRAEEEKRRAEEQRRFEEEQRRREEALAQERERLEAERRKLEQARSGDGRKHVPSITVANARDQARLLLDEALAGLADSDEVEIEIVVRRRNG